MAKIMKEKEENKASQNKAKSTSAKKKTLADQIKAIPRSVQQTIPYKSIFSSGMIQTDDTHYSKTYRLTDINFKTEEEAAQEAIFLEFEGILNGLDASMTGQLTCFNRSIDTDRVRNKILMEPAKDGLNKYRDEFNEIVLEKMKEGRNNIIKEKYFTVSVEADNPEDASIKFSHIDQDINAKLRRISGVDTVPLTVDERLSLLYDIYNENASLPFYKKIEGITYKGKLDLKAVNRQGLSSKDLIAPPSFVFYRDYFEMGEIYGRVLYIENLPTLLSTDVLDTLSDLPCNLIANVMHMPIDGDKASKMIKHRITDINENIIRAQQKAAKNGYSGDILPSELVQAKEQAEELRNDMQSRNQKLFQTVITVVLFADSKAELEHHTKSIESAAITHLCSAVKLLYQQEVALNTSLPLGLCHLALKRTLTTESAAVFIPYTIQDISQEKGYYYGLNAVSRNLIMYDRLDADNYNGMIFGKPGSGKSFIAKTEIINTLLKTQDDVYVIDPNGEYLPLAQNLNGENVRIAIGAKEHINPLDMDVQFAGDEGEDPIALKCDYLTSLCDIVLKRGSGMEMNPIMTNIVHRCGREIYKAYWKTMEKQVRTKGITCDREAMPTLVDFYQALLMEGSGPAQILASALEMYCIGNYDLFAHRTNINPESRFIVYDIKDIPAGMKELALQICLNDVWNRILQNKKKKKKTWFYIDEFHLLTKNEASATFVAQIYKMARKFGGIPTGITQNVEDVYTNETGGGIINNCNFLLMLNQSHMDRNTLQKLHDIPEPLLEYITDKPAGTGLIYTGKTVLPFVNEFPANNDLYRIMSTKATESHDVINTGLDDDDDDDDDLFE